MEQGPDDVPTMEVVKMLEADMVVPTIPNRPKFMVERMDDAEVSMGSKGFSFFFWV